MLLEDFSFHWGQLAFSIIYTSAGGRRKFILELGNFFIRKKFISQKLVQGWASNCAFIPKMLPNQYPTQPPFTDNSMQSQFVNQNHSQQPFNSAQHTDSFSSTSQRGFPSKPTRPTYDAYQQPTAPLLPRQLEPVASNQPVLNIPLIGTVPDVASLSRAATPFVSSTLSCFPATSGILSKSKLAFALSLSPNSSIPSIEKSVPVVTGLIVRCKDCRSYLNPFVEFFDQGTRFHCNICQSVNSMPPEYDYDFRTKALIDRSTRAELLHPVVEFEATDEYMIRPPQPPIFLFMFEVTTAAIASGVIPIVAKTIKQALDTVPNTSERAKVGFITYDSAVHFYSFCSELDAKDATCCVVKDFDEIYAPVPPDQLIVSLKHYRSQIDRLLDLLPEMYSQGCCSGNAFGTALRFAMSLLSVSGGRIVSVQCSLPNEQEGAIRSRDDATALGTAKEYPLLQPSTMHYKNLAIDCTQSQTSVDCFFVSRNSFLDIATISNIATYTGGTSYYYPNFNISRSGDVVRLSSELAAVLGQPFGLEAVLRVRASRNVTIESYFGNFFMRSADLLCLPNINYGHSYVVTASPEDAITSKHVSFQSALLYTTSEGERRIRVVNYAVPVVDTTAALFASANQQALTAVFGKMAIEQIVSNRLDAARDFLTTKCIEIISAYRTSVANSTTPNSPIVLPQNLFLLPFLLHSLSKSTALRAGNSVSLDVRSKAILDLRTATVAKCTAICAPYFCLLNGMQEADCVARDLSSSAFDLNFPMLSPLNLTSERIAAFRDGVFLLATCDELLLWVSSATHPSYLNALFRCKEFQEVENGRTILQLDESCSFSLRVLNLLRHLRALHGIQHETVIVIREDADAALRSLFLGSLSEDRFNGLNSYVQFLMQLREKIAPNS